MNIDGSKAEYPSDKDSYRSLQLLSEISRESSVSQRDLSRRLNIALGLVNSYIRNLMAKGLVKIREIPPKRYAYYLTPKGFAEKSRLTFQVLRAYTALYRDARRDLVRLFRSLTEQGSRRVVFAGLDELAEIAFLSLQESGGELVGIVDDDHAGETFFKVNVLPVARAETFGPAVFVIASYLRREEVRDGLLAAGVPPENICTIGHHTFGENDSETGEHHGP